MAKITPKFLENGLMDIEDLKVLEAEAKTMFEDAERHLQHVQAVLRSAVIYNSKMEAENAVNKNKE